MGITEADLLLIARIVEEGEDDELIKCVVDLEQMLEKRRHFIANHQPIDSSPPSLTFTTYGGNKSSAFDGTDYYLSSEEDDNEQQSSFVAARDSPLTLSISSHNLTKKKKKDTKRRSRTPKQRQIRSIVATSIEESSPSPPLVSSADETPSSPDSAISAMKRLFDEIGSQDLVLCPRDDDEEKPQRRSIKKTKPLLADTNTTLVEDVIAAPKASWPKRGGRGGGQKKQV